MWLQGGQEGKAAEHGVARTEMVCEMGLSLNRKMRVADVRGIFLQVHFTPREEGLCSHMVQRPELTKRVRTVWLVETPDDPPRLITAYPAPSGG